MNNFLQLHGYSKLEQSIDMNKIDTTLVNRKKHTMPLIQRTIQFNPGFHHLAMYSKT